jgi:Ser/Thr protein kinase RdoA (MazF antagonist)
MKPYEQLTQRGQVQRIKALASAALSSYDLEVIKLELLFHGENTTFRARLDPAKSALDEVEHLASDSVLVRCHRPFYNTAVEIESELMWMAALDDAGVPVQSPLRNDAGEFVTRASHDGVPVDRDCTVMRWTQGRFAPKPKPVHLERLGKLTATLHEHARSWELPEGFERRSWDYAGLFHDIKRRPHGESIWAPFDADQQRVQEAAMEISAAFLERCERDSERIVIHSDLHFGNVLFGGGRALPIDFDDAGFGFPIQDAATSLGRWDIHADLEEYRRSYFQGYASVSSNLPDESALLAGMITRRAQLALWLSERAREIDAFAKMLPEWLIKHTAALEHLIARLEQRS